MPRRRVPPGCAARDRRPARDAGIYGGTFVVSIIAGLVPLVNTELFHAALVRLAVERSSQLLAAGAMKIRFKAFLVIGLLGRLVRFTALVAITWAA